MARRRHPRGLRPDEAELWRRYARTATPLPGRRDAAPGAPRPAPAAPEAPPERPGAAPPDFDAFAIGARARPAGPSHDLSPTLSERLAAQPVRMDARAFTRMKRGKLAIDGRIDLHGLTLDEAQPRLTAFILSAQASGKRLVLVITGKGRDRDDGGPIPQRRGALRAQVPRWLATGALAGAVLQITEAHRSHGGSGAYYVYLRRRPR